MELYFKNVTAFSTLPAKSIVPAVVPSSQTVQIPIQSNVQYNISWNPKTPSLVKYIKYEISSANFPSFVTASSACVSSSCFSAGLPANWIVEQPTAVSVTHLAQALASIIRSISYLNSGT